MVEGDPHRPLHGPHLDVEEEVEEGRRSSRGEGEGEKKGRGGREEGEEGGPWSFWCEPRFKPQKNESFFLILCVTTKINF